MDDAVGTELLKCNLAIESDIQNFVGFVLTAVQDLGGNAFSATPPTLEVIQVLRNAGAGSGYPLPVELRLTDFALSVHRQDDDALPIAHLPVIPTQQKVDKLRTYLRQSTEVSDPSVLLKRNAEMTRYLNETRARTEKELEGMQRTLTQRQEELSDTMRKAETDQLTGLLNRRAYDEKLEHSYKRTVRLKGENLSLILFDLDYFKNINDEFGHQYGDEYLKKMAAAMLSVIRQDVDYAFRFGGDEFALLMFADKHIAIARALKLLSLMNNKVSIGIVSLSAERNCSTNVQDFIKRADDALYQAKHAGRGRAVYSTCEADGSSGWEAFLPEPLAT
ncbi:MAG: GGDEF domain-containing protein [Thiobacillus sp.]